MLVTLMKLYEDFSNSSGNGTPLSEAEFDLQVMELTRCLEDLVEGAGKYDVTGRWREDLERIMNLVKEICLGEQKEASHDEITSTVFKWYSLCFGYSISLIYQSITVRTSIYIFTVLKYSTRSYLNYA